MILLVGICKRISRMMVFIALMTTECSPMGSIISNIKTLIILEFYLTMAHGIETTCQKQIKRGLNYCHFDLGASNNQNDRVVFP